MEARNHRVMQFMEQRHYLTLARKHDEIDLAKKITQARLLPAYSLVCLCQASVPF